MPQIERFEPVSQEKSWGTETLIARDDARARLGLDGMILISAGRLVSWKGFSALIDATEKLVPEIPDIRLIIAGSGPDETVLKKQVKDKGLVGRVRFLGSVSQKDLWEYFMASDAFILDSGYEGFSHTVLEAMAAGAPIIVSGAGGNPEMVRHGKEGIVISYGDDGALADAIRAIARDPASARARAKNASARAREFSGERMIKDTIKILTSDF